MGLNVYVMRHGETEANVREVLSGRTDSPFTDAGRRHPAGVADHLTGVDLVCIYSSPMKRALRTAGLVLEHLGRRVPVRTEAAIAEIDAGEFTGLPFEEVRSRLPADAVLGSFRYPGGESWEDVQERAVRFVSGLENRHDPDEAVLLVTHAGVIAGLVADQLDEPIRRFVRTRFGHDFLGRLRVEDHRLVDYERIVGTVDSWL